MKRITTRYTFRTGKIDRTLRLAVVSDLHSGPFDDVLEELARCDAVLVPGDLVDRHRKDNRLAMRFLEVVPEIVPVFYAIGNHERKFGERQMLRQKISESGATLLDNRSVRFHGVCIGGLSSRKVQPDLAFLDRFEKEDGYRLLMCHHPEVWRDAVEGRDIDLTLCGHAHGGQIQLFGRGLYAPGQGLFPRMTYGLHGGGRMLVSRGMTNNVSLPVPRINNPCELIILNLERTDEHGPGRPETADRLD